MKRFLAVMLGVLLIAAITTPALAWEFAMTGEMEWRYRYFARQGSGDLFGSTSLNPITGLPDQAALGLAGPVNNAVLVQGFSAKGADAQTNETRVWLYPEIRVNPAIRLRGEYRVTGTNLRGLYDGTGINGTATPGNNWVTNFGYNGWFFNAASMPGNSTTPSGMSVGVWEKFWATAQTPWGLLVFGRRPFAFGLGWSTYHEKDANSETITIVAPYGPMIFIIGLAYATPDGIGVNSVPVVGVANVAPAFAQAVNNVRAAYGTDKGRYYAWDFASALTYRNGPVETGVLYIYVKAANNHFIEGAFGPGLRDDAVRGFAQAITLGGFGLGGLPLYGDLDFVLSVNYFKYNNGRFFFNAEYDFQYEDIVRKGGRPLDLRAEAWMVELGTLCGPSKLSLASFYSSGQDRRGGVFNGGPPIGNIGITNVYDRWSQFVVLGGRVEAIRPYVWLLGDIYGTGNNSYDDRGRGTYNDFFAYAARLDYAVAANLNVWGSYIYAMRASNTGTPVASFRGGVANVGFRVSPGFNAAGIQILPVPNVPDDYLGWEANVGLNWKLLEGLTFNGQFAYWQPGDWFKYAYVDYSNTNTVSMGGLAGIPINPNRGIDPLIGFQGSLVVDF